MSNMELEKAAMGPRRWIELCGASEKKDDPAILRPRATRIINDSFPNADFKSIKNFLVPGGRYLVTAPRYSSGSISVFDLGYTLGADYNLKIIASIGLERGSRTFLTQATPDGMGLTILSSNAFQGSSVYESYPQSETPHLIQIAHIDFSPTKKVSTHLLPGIVIWYDFHIHRIIFTIWDYRRNHSICFSVSVDISKYVNLEVMATKAAIIILCEKTVLICAIPPLSPYPPDFSDISPIHIPPLFTIPFPDGTTLPPARVRWNAISPWYFGSSQPLYFDLFCKGLKVQRFQITLKPDLSSASLHVINAFELTPHDFNYVSTHAYMICEDTLVSCWNYDGLGGRYRCGVYTGVTPIHYFAMSHGGPEVLFNRRHMCVIFLCPASGRLVLLNRRNHDRVTVLDIF